MFRSAVIAWPIVVALCGPGCASEDEALTREPDRPLDGMVLCTGSPSELAVPFAQAPPELRSLTLRWQLTGDCVTATYDPRLESRRQDIEAALTAWDDVDCHRLCFTPLVSSDVRPDRTKKERRVHFTVTTPSDPGLQGYDSYVQVNWEMQTGRLSSAELLVSEDSITTIPLTKLLRGVGRVSGLADAPDANTVTVMSLVPRTDLSTPTPADRDSICRLYGDPAYCNPADSAD